MKQKRHSISFNPLSIIHDINRFLEILRVLAHHGFGHLVAEITKDNSGISKRIQIPSDSVKPKLDDGFATYSRVRMVLQDLGPTFIKLGQILSTRPDLIPPELITELNKLQDEVQPFSFDEAKQQIETELGHPLDRIFSRFDSIPIGTASIGQVYAAALASGEEVVVKVRRPNVENIIKRDIELLYYLAQSVEKRVPQLRTLDPSGIVYEFDRAVFKELDYDIERSNIQKFAELFSDSKDIVIPKIYREYCTKHVLTMERIMGVKITQFEKLGCNGPALAKAALQAVLAMVFRCGFFHADPHPGNIFALPENRIAFLDMGMVGRLDDRMRFKLADVILAIMEQDLEEVANIIYSLGSREKKVSRTMFNRDIAEVMDRILGKSLEDIHFAEIVKDLLECARCHEIRIPHEFTLMGKALITVESIAKELDPGLSMEAELAPFVRELIAIRYSPKRITKNLFKRAMQFYHWSNELPEHVMTVLDDLQSGNLKVKVEQPDQDNMLKNIDRIVGKLIFGLITCSLIISSTFFLTLSRFDHAVFGVPLNMWFGISGYIAAAFAGLQTIRKVVRTHEDN